MIPSPPDWEARCQAMVQEQILRRGISNIRVLEAMSRVPRHLFVSEDLRMDAYQDRPLPIGLGQTISQPYMVAYMLESLQLSGSEKVLEIGTGSGYETAALSYLAGSVYTIEVEFSLAEQSRRLLESMGIQGVHFKIGDGLLGWPEASPFDRIILSAAAFEEPKELLEQVASEGVLLAPIGSLQEQRLCKFKRSGSIWQRTELMGVLFVPMRTKATES